MRHRGPKQPKKKKEITKQKKTKKRESGHPRHHPLVALQLVKHCEGKVINIVPTIVTISGVRPVTCVIGSVGMIIRVVVAVPLGVILLLGRLVTPNVTTLSFTK